MRPEEALRAARERARRARSEGLYPEAVAPAAIGATSERVSSDQLMEWAVIEPSMSEVISTRRLGAPITWVKGRLVHALRQYLAQLESQQTRFNVHLLARVVEQEERMAIVEDWLREESATPAPELPPRAP